MGNSFFALDVMLTRNINNWLIYIFVLCLCYMAAVNRQETTYRTVTIYKTNVVTVTKTNVVRQFIPIYSNNLETIYSIKQENQTNIVWITNQIWLTNIVKLTNLINPQIEWDDMRVYLHSLPRIEQPPVSVFR